MNYYQENNGQNKIPKFEYNILALKLRKSVCLRLKPMLGSILNFKFIIEH